MSYLSKFDFLELLQLFTKYLRQILIFMWNSALREKLNFYFAGEFY